jgi:hypothetical protein
MKEYRLRKFVVEEGKDEPRMIFSRFFKTVELSKVAAQEDQKNKLDWIETSESLLETISENVIYDIKTFEFEGA